QRRSKRRSHKRTDVELRRVRGHERVDDGVGRDCLCEATPHTCANPSVGRVAMSKNLDQVAAVEVTSVAEHRLHTVVMLLRNLHEGVGLLVVAPTGVT